MFLLGKLAPLRMPSSAKQKRATNNCNLHASFEKQKEAERKNAGVWGLGSKPARPCDRKLPARVEDFSTLLFMTQPETYWGEPTSQKPAADDKVPTTESSRSLKNSRVWISEARIRSACEKCVSHGGFNKRGIAIINVYPTMFPNMKHPLKPRDNKPVPPEEYNVVMFNLSRYIPEKIQAMTKGKPFIVVYRDLVERVGCFFPSGGWAEKIFNSLQDRCGENFKNLIIYRPAGQINYILFKYRTNLRPFASVEVENKLIIANTQVQLAWAQTQELARDPNLSC